MNHYVNFLLVFLSIASIGCTGRPSRVSLAKIDYANAARLAIEKFDQDGDQKLNASELESCPALLVAIQNVDTENNGSIAQDELENYLRQMQSRRVSMVRWKLRVLVDGKPLSGATVALEPAGFLMPGVLPAEGVTDESGLVSLSVAEEHRPSPNAHVVHCGLYNATVSKKNTSQDNIALNQSFGIEVRPEGQTDIGKAIINLSTSG